MKITPDNHIDILAKKRDELITSIINKKEKLYKDAITFVSNGKEWSNEEISKRCIIEINQGTQSEIFLIDNIPMIIFFPNECSQKVDLVSSKMMCEFKYRELYKH